jgi:hypothetical protein
MGERNTSAPTIADVDNLRDLEENWDFYGSSPIDERAIAAVKGFVAVPTGSGGIIIESADGTVQIDISADGTIESVYFGRA